jgi:hypothetical protein
LNAGKTHVRVIKRLESTPLRLKALVLSLGLACVAHNVAAQTTSNASLPIQAGTRVRVTTPTMVSPLIANFLEQRGDTVVFIEDGRGRGVWSFGLAQIDKIETTAGETGRSKSAMKKGALIGGAIGLATGLIFASTFDPSSDNRKYSRMQTGIVTGLAGAGFGFFIGSLVSTERWVSVPLPKQFTNLPTVGAGFRIGLGR